MKRGGDWKVAPLIFFMSRLALCSISSRRKSLTWCFYNLGVGDDFDKLNVQFESKDVYS